MENECKQPLRIGRIRVFNVCAGSLFGATTRHNHKNSENKSKKYAMTRNWSNQNPSPAIKTNTTALERSVMNYWGLSFTAPISPLVSEVVQKIKLVDRFA